MYYSSDPTTAGRNIELGIWLEGIKVVLQVRNYLYSQWNHICWSYSSITGMTKFHVNGKLVSNMTIQKGYVIEATDNVVNTSFVIGQDMDKIDGGFQHEQVFFG